MYPKILILKKTQVSSLIFFTALLAVSIVAPLFHFQPITGPIVNAALFLGAMFLPIEFALILCLLPSLVALSLGTLPLALAPMVPFIMASNAILVVAFASVRHMSDTVAIITASVLKFLFLFSTSYIVIHLIVQKPIAQKAAAMMSWPQLSTALLGGLLAFVILRLSKK